MAAKHVNAGQRRGEGSDDADEPDSPAQASIETVLDRLAPQPGMWCLVLGTGSGELASTLADRVDPGSVVSLDPRQPAVAEPGRQADWTGGAVHPVRSLATRLPFPRASFGRVLAVNADPLLEESGMVAEIVRVLEQGGRLLVLDDRPTGPDRPLDPPVPWGTLAEELAEAGFEQVSETEPGSMLVARRSTRP